MLRRVLPYWRVFGTSLGFLAVGVGGVLVFPLINVFIRRRQLRTEVALSINRRKAPDLIFRIVESRSSDR